MKLPKYFHNEENELTLKGLNSWESIMCLTDVKITSLVTNTLCTTVNLKKLRCIATFICKLNTSLEESALLMHSGISSVEALSQLTPHQVVLKTGRIERSLGIKREQLIDLRKASILIKKAISN